MILGRTVRPRISHLSPLVDINRSPSLSLDKFVGVLHEAISSGLRDGVDEIQINGAIQTQDGWMHIHGNVPFTVITM